MGIKIQSIEEAVGDNGIKILVHGPAGAGKTVLCATAGQPTILISAESGLLSIKGAVENGLLPESVMKLVKVIEVKSIDDLKDVYDMLADDHLCDWVALDSISEIAEVVLENEKENSRDARQAYGNLSTEMNNILRKFRDLPRYNVVMSCKQQRLVDPDTDLVTYGPSMPGAKLGGAIPYLFDEVFALRVEKDDDGEDYRILQTSRDRKFEAKDRSGKLKMFEEPSLFSIMKKIKGNNTKKNVTTAEEQENITASQEQDVSVSDKDRYFYHDESDSYWILPKGEKWPEAAEAEMSVEISKDDYEAGKAFATSNNDSEETQIFTFAEKKMYWLHLPTGKTATTEKGDDITDYLNDDKIEEITKVKYEKIKIAE